MFPKITIEGLLKCCFMKCKKNVRTFFAKYVKCGRTNVTPISSTFQNKTCPENLKINCMKLEKLGKTVYILQRSKTHKSAETHIFLKHSTKIRMFWHLFRSGVDFINYFAPYAQLLRSFLEA